MVRHRGDSSVGPHHRTGARANAGRGASERRRPPHRAYPDKHDVYTTIEATIAHFKLVMEGLQASQAGEVYSLYRRRQRRARFPHREQTEAERRTACAFARRAGTTSQASREMILGGMIADIIPTFRLREHDRRRVRSMSTASKDYVMPKFVLDGKEIPFEPGETVMQRGVARRASRFRTTAGIRASEHRGQLPHVPGPQSKAGRQMAMPQPRVGREQGQKYVPDDQAEASARRASCRRPPRTWSSPPPMRR